MNPLTAFAVAVLATAVATTAPTLAATRAAGPQTASPTSLVVRQVPGSYHIAVSGRTLPSTPLVLTVFGTVSSDIPDIVVNRRQVVTDAAGGFNLEVSAAGDYFRESPLTVVATSPSGALLAKSQIILKAPNANVEVPNESRLKAES